MTKEEFEQFLAHLGTLDMNAMGTVEEYLEQFGVKGMKWGVRKSLSTSDDAKDLADINRQAKIGGSTSLTNKELEDAIKRMDLEAKYKKYKGDASYKQRGLKLVGKLLLSFGKDYISSYIKHPAANAATGGNFAWAYAGARTIDGIVVNNRLPELGS